MIGLWKDAEEKARAIEMTDAAYREDSIAGLEAHYDKLRDLAPRLLQHIERLEATLAQPHMVWAAEQHSVGIDIVKEDQRLRERLKALADLEATMVVG